MRKRDRICIARCRQSARSARRPASRSIPRRLESAIEYVLNDVDLILVMTVNPGFGGQKFIAETQEKIRKIKAMIGSRPIDLEVDGGITAETAALAPRLAPMRWSPGPPFTRADSEAAYRSNIDLIRSSCVTGS